MATSLAASYPLVAQHLDVIHQNGKIDYPSLFDDPADGDRLAGALTAGVLRIMQIAPKNNIPWKTYKLAVLANMADPARAWADTPSDATARTNLAEDEATKLRCIDFHIRRERYRKRHPIWMQAFEQDAATAHSTAPAPSPQHGVAPPTHTVTPATTFFPAAAAPSAIVAMPPHPAPAPAVSLPPALGTHSSTGGTTTAGDWLGRQHLMDDSWAASDIDDMFYSGSELNDSEENDTDGRDCAWQASYKIERGEIKAYREMITSTGEVVGSKEQAIDIVPPSDGSLFAFGTFLDGSCITIPNLIYSSIPKILKKAAAHHDDTRSRKRGLENQAAGAVPKQGKRVDSSIAAKKSTKPPVAKALVRQKPAAAVTKTAVRRKPAAVIKKIRSRCEAAGGQGRGQVIVKQRRRHISGGTGGSRGIGGRGSRGWRIG